MCDMRIVDTVIDEGKDFIDRHPELQGVRLDFGGERKVDAADMGGLLWGLLRAVAECPSCPGVFRVPLDEEWNRLICPNCKRVWRKIEEEDGRDG